MVVWGIVWLIVVVMSCFALLWLFWVFCCDFGVGGAWLVVGFAIWQTVVFLPGWFVLFVVIIVNSVVYFIYVCVVCRVCLIAWLSSVVL